MALGHGIACCAGDHIIADPHNLLQGIQCMHTWLATLIALMGHLIKSIVKSIVKQGRIPPCPVCALKGQSLSCSPS